MNRPTLEDRLHDLFGPLAVQAAPPSLRASVDGIPNRYSRRGWRDLFTRRSTLILLAAALSAALAAGSLLAGAGSNTQPSPAPIATPQPAAPMSVASLLAGLGNPAWAELGPMEAEPAYSAGLRDNSAHLQLPAGYRALGAREGLVASILQSPTGGGDRLSVQDVATGREVARYATGSYGGSGGFILKGGLLGSSAVYFVRLGTHPDPVIPAIQIIDTAAGGPPAGVFAFDLGTGSVKTLISPDAARLASLVLSPSGQTLASELLATGADGARQVDVIQLATGAISRFAVRGNIELASDRVLVTSDNANLYAYEIAGGSLAWTIPGGRLDRGYVTSDGSRMVIQQETANTSEIASVDTTSGTVHTLVTVPTGQPADYLWTQLSGDRAAVFLPGSPAPQAGFLAGNGVVRPSILDLAAGSITANAFMITEQ